MPRSVGLETSPWAIPFLEAVIRQPKALEAARSMLSSEGKRLAGVLESCRERFGKTVQEQFEKRKADKNARKTKKQKNELNPSLFNTHGFLL